jgi:hypothetical protein
MNPITQYQKPRQEQWYFPSNPNQTPKVLPSGPGQRIYMSKMSL